MACFVGSRPIVGLKQFTATVRLVSGAIGNIGAHTHSSKLAVVQQKRWIAEQSPPEVRPQIGLSPLQSVVRNRPQEREITTSELDKHRQGRERIVVLGSGWAGYPFSRTIDHSKYQVIIISPRSYFVFTPLLTETSVGTLEFRTALEPIRARKSGTQFVQGWADDVDFYNKRVTIEEAVADPSQGYAPVEMRNGNNDKNELEMKTQRQDLAKKGRMFDLAYDKLVISVGCYSQTFNTPGVKEHAFFLKEPGDARRIRKRLLECFEVAALPTTQDEIRRQILSFAVVGGGPTGIEFAAQLHDIVYEDLVKIYPELVQFVTMTVYDVAPKVLGMFDEQLANYASQTFKRQGIEIKTSRRIEHLSAGLPNVSATDLGGRPGLTLKIKDEPEKGIGMCVWSTGLMANPFIAKEITRTHRFHHEDVIYQLDQRSAHTPDEAPSDWTISKDMKTGSISTNDRLRVLLETTPLPGSKEPQRAYLKDVFALGDCAQVKGTMYPATAQVANQKAAWLAKHLNKGDLNNTRFEWNNMGVMAYLGSWTGIVQGGKGLGNLSGRAAWVVWKGAYLVKSLSWRNRVLIPVYWMINWVFGRDISRF